MALNVKKPIPNASSIMGQVNGQLPVINPLKPGQAQAQIGAELVPYSAAIKKQLASTSTALSGATQNLARDLGAINYSAPYTDVEARQSAIDAALQSSQGSAGTSVGQDLQSRLASIGSPDVVANAVNAITGRGAAEGSTGLAQGSASLSNLLSDEAANNAYGQKLPGIAKQQGLLDLSTANNQAQQSVANEAGTLEQQLPTILQNSQTRADQRSTDRANLGQQLTSDQQTQTSNNRTGEEAAIIGSGYGPDGTLTPAAQKALSDLFPGVDPSAFTGDSGKATTTGGTPKIIGSAGSGYYKVNTDGSLTQVLAPKKTGSGTTKTGTYSESLSKQLGIIVDGSGRPILKNGQPQSYHGKPATTKPTVSSSTYNHMVSLATSLRGPALGSSPPLTDVVAAYKRLVSYAVGNGANDTEAAQKALNALNTAGYNTGGL